MCGSSDISLRSFSFVETLVAPADSACGSLSAEQAPQSGVLSSIFRFLVL